MTVLLREAHLRQLVAMRDLVPLMEDALAALSTRRAIQPLRSVVPVQPHGLVLGVMPAYLASSDALGLKAVTVAPSNTARGLPTHLATVLLMAPETGELLAVLDGRLITEMRTAAASAAATRRLARPDASVWAILGAGVQARSHLEALGEALPRPADVRLWNRTPNRAVQLCAEVRDRLGLLARPVATPEDAVRGADIVCTVTGSPTPVLEGKWLAPGAHVNAVGSARPDMRELDTEAVVRARVFVDSREAALSEAGDLLIPIHEGAIAEGHVQGEIGEVFAGVREGRTAPGEITLFKSVGVAVEDVATARLAYDRALRGGVGEEVSLT